MRACLDVCLDVCMVCMYGMYVWYVWYGTVRYGTVRYGMVWYVGMLVCISFSMFQFPTFESFALAIWHLETAAACYIPNCRVTFVH